MGLLPQERDGKLAARRAAQQKPDWSWDEEQDTKWNRIGELIQVVQTAEANEEELVIFNPEDKELFLRAVELVHKKRFQAGGEGIRDLSFLERLPQMKELDLWDNDIEDLSPLAFLTGPPAQVQAAGNAELKQHWPGGTSPTWSSAEPRSWICMRIRLLPAWRSSQP